MLCLRWWHHDRVSSTSVASMKYCVLVALVICHVNTTAHDVTTIDTHNLMTLGYIGRGVSEVLTGEVG